MSAKVLLIDDDQDFRASVRTLLESHGYEVLEAGSGREGLRRSSSTSRTLSSST